MAGKITGMANYTVKKYTIFKKIFAPCYGIINKNNSGYYSE